MNGWHKALLNRLAALDGIAVDEQHLAKLLAEQVDTSTLSDGEWSALATLNHVVRPAIAEAQGGKEPEHQGVSDAEWAELLALDEAERRRRS